MTATLPAEAAVGAPDPTPIDALLAIGAHLLPLRIGEKKPLQSGWPDAAPMDRDAALAHVAGGGGLGVNVGASGLIALDAENAAATQLLVELGFIPDVETANAQVVGGVKEGGRHFYLRVPDGVSVRTVTAIDLDGAGAKMDFLADRRYAVAPPTALAKSGGHQYRIIDGSPLARAALHAAPQWLFDRTYPAPTPAGARLRDAILAVKAPRVPRGDGAERDATTEAIDAVSWPDWLASDPRIEIIGSDGSCGCEVFHWAESSTPRSGILHDGCDYGYRIQVFSGTLAAKWGRTAGSRLHFAAWLHGVSETEAAAAHGITLGGCVEAEYDAGLGPDALDAKAVELEADGDAEGAARWKRAAADVRMRIARRSTLAPAATFRISGGLTPPPVINLDGALAPVIDIGRVQEATVDDAVAEADAEVAAAAALDDPMALAAAERRAEAARIEADLQDYLRSVPPGNRSAEIDALLGMTLSDRDDAKAAAVSGRLTRLGLMIDSLTGPASAYAWRRLREGAAGPWSLAGDLPPLDPADLDLLLAAEPPKATMGGGLFYERGLHILAGPGGCGKTWIALDTCRRAIPAPDVGPADTYGLYLDLDQNLRLPHRLLDLGVSRHQLQQRRVATVNVGEVAASRREGVIATLRSIVASLVEAVTPPAVVVIDSLTRVMSETMESSNDADAITRSLGILNTLAERTCVIVLDHVGHSAEDRPSGSAAKINAARVVLALTPKSSDAAQYPDTIASASVTITKDRDGGLRHHAAGDDREARPTAGLVVIDRAAGTGATAVKFIPQRVVSEARERRNSDEGRAAAMRVCEKVLEIVAEAAAKAVTAEEAVDRGCMAVPPLSQQGIEVEVCKLFADDKAIRRSDIRAVIKSMIDDKTLIPITGRWGRGSAGVRYQVAPEDTGD